MPASALCAAAASFRENPAFDSAQALQEIGTGEALVSFLAEDGSPCMVERARVLFPQCSMSAASQGALGAVIAGQADLQAKYGEAVDRESAFEMIGAERAASEESARLAAEREAFEKEKAEFEKKRAAEEAKAAKDAERELARQQKEAEKAAERAERAAEKEAERQRRAQERQVEQMKRAAGSIIGTIGREASRQLVRGIFGSLKR